MECFDISHFSGTDVVASMTVFQSGEPKKSAYRRFKVKVQQNNDFESMHETLLRRLSKIGNSEDESFNAHPDLIVIDGGKGQLSRAQDAMREAGVYVNMISLAESDEIIYFPDKSEGLYLSRRSPALALLMRLRDEAHRFAVDYATRLHTNRLKVSSLKDIEGIGDKKRIFYTIISKPLTESKPRTLIRLRPSRVFREPTRKKSAHSSTAKIKNNF